MGPVLIICFILCSCRDDCDQNSLSNAYDEVDSRGTEYYADPTNRDKCQAYVKSLEDCIDQMKTCDVDPTMIESYENSLESAKDECN